MAEFDRPTDAQFDAPGVGILLTNVWVDGVPVDVTGDMGLEFMPVNIGFRGGSGAGKRRRKKLRFPSRFHF